MSDERFRVMVPEGMHPWELWGALDQVMGQNVRLYAHYLYHTTQEDEQLSNTERTIKFAQIQALLDYADLIDSVNTETSQQLKIHFNWAIA